MRSALLTTANTHEIDGLTGRQRAFFPADEQPPINLPKERKGKMPAAVKVKMEKPSDETGEDDDDEDKSEGDGASHDESDATRTAEEIYKKALRALKFKLYFENFFPTDTEKDSLPYSCWVSAAASISEVDSESAAVHKMFYNHGYDDKVRALTNSSCSSTLDTSPLPTPA